MTNNYARNFSKKPSGGILYVFLAQVIKERRGKEDK